MTFSKRLRAPCFAATLVLLTLGASVASADIGNPFVSTLSVANSALSGTTGPYGTVTVNLLTSTTASIVFRADSGFAFTDGSSADANGSFTFTSATGDCSSCTYSSGGTGNVDGLGSFAAQADSGNSGPGGRSSTITLTVTDTGTAWTDASQVLTGNPTYDAAAHVFVTTGSATGLTGYVGEPAGSGSSTPEPASMALLGSGLIGIGALVRRRRNKLAA